jgi:tripartite ATP-independent transporter DctM subunit
VTGAVDAHASMTEGAKQPGRAAAAFEAFIKLVELIAACLVLIEVVILSSGVISRYLLHKPLLWSDELARFFFLWLTMLGAVIASHRGRHMRLSVVVGYMPPGLRVWCENLAEIVVVGFLVSALMPSYGFVELQYVQQITSLDMSDSYRVAANFTGIVLMLVFALGRLAERASVMQFATGLVLVVVVVVGLWALKPVLVGMGNLNLIIFFGLLLGICVAIGVPIAFAFGASTMLYIQLLTRSPALVEIAKMDEGMSPLILLSVPLFIFLGALIEMTGIARALVAFMSALVGHIRGGLSFVLLGAMFLVSGISGAKSADMAAIAPGLLPEMRKRGLNPPEFAALMAASGAMSETIPPSIVLILVSSAASVSIASLFTGGLLPAFVLALTLAVTAYFRSPPVSAADIAARPNGKTLLRLFVWAMPAIALPFAIRSAVVNGVTTATEVAVVGVLYSIVVGPLVYGRFDWRRIYPSLVETAILSGSVLLILGAATGMAWALTQSGFSHQLVVFMTSMPGGYYGFLAMSIVGFAILGSVLEGAPAILVFGPLLFPVARALGVHEIHYAMIIIIAMGIGLFAPPFGIGYYYASAIAQVPPDSVVGRIWPYLGMLLVGLIVIALVPWLSIGFL